MQKIKLSGFVLFASLSLLCATQANAQSYSAKKAQLTENELKRWSHLDMEKDSVPGMSVDRAYAELLKGKKSNPVIVGIIDSGVDIEHPDLQSVVWTNKKEIAGNGIDDDKNGYVDDIHGWNFLGNITKENYEYARIANDKNLVDDATYQKAKKEFDGKFQESLAMKTQMEKALEGTTKADALLQKELKKETYTVEDIETITSTDKDVVRAKMVMTQMLGYGLPVAELLKEIKKQLDEASTIASGAGFVDYRKTLGDNPNDLKDTKYGDNNVIGPDKEEALHGTHVAGIVAQSRNNGIGGDGIADNVQILTCRAVPDGDEYDKDIALAIRYAVDNGAKVINASFGKSFSPHKQWVYDAIKYAEKKDVLIVHAAGNDAKDIDVEDNFPNDSDDKKTEFAANVLTIGALNPAYGENIVADFSNYGQLNVDIFAPGVQIYATTPKESYQFLQGTSMASPNVAGVAALIRSYYPKLSAKQVKQIIMASGTQVDQKVLAGEDGSPKEYKTLSVSGKFVNAYKALQMAEQVSKGKIKEIKG
ncbi:S8 family peptidase [Flavobacterium aurantiibacter]|uniref:Peptidase S8 n=1 Tax=Flavobacterium aurantiibacter TaxID=2023067 RepID=A0A256A3I2_9FLAO|nr:S8 family peptidase [Flavobacterium aurantiibacter]OYQ48191.1 peptidase S8 [Flavobacterium aurantiibacter]